MANTKRNSIPAPQFTAPQYTSPQYTAPRFTAQESTNHFSSLLSQHRDQRSMTSARDLPTCESRGQSSSRVSSRRSRSVSKSRERHAHVKNRRSRSPLSVHHSHRKRRHTRSKSRERHSRSKSRERHSSSKYHVRLTHSKSHGCHSRSQSRGRHSRFNSRNRNLNKNRRDSRSSSKEHSCDRKHQYATYSPKLLGLVKSEPTASMPSSSKLDPLEYKFDDFMPTASGAATSSDHATSVTYFLWTLHYNCKYMLHATEGIRPFFLCPLMRKIIENSIVRETPPTTNFKCANHNLHLVFICMLASELEALWSATSFFAHERSVNPNYRIIKTLYLHKEFYKTAMDIKTAPDVKLSLGNYIKLSI